MGVGVHVRVVFVGVCEVRGRGHSLHDIVLINLPIEHKTISKWQTTFQEHYFCAISQVTPSTNFLAVCSSDLLVLNSITGKLQTPDTLCQCLLGHTLKHWLL